MAPSDAHAQQSSLGKARLRLQNEPEGIAKQMAPTYGYAWQSTLLKAVWTDQKELEISCYLAMLMLLGANADGQSGHNGRVVQEVCSDQQRGLAQGASSFRASSFETCI